MSNELFYAEFRGFFWGEGCADVQKIHRKESQYPIYRPRLRISLRGDDSAILETIYGEFGGSLSYSTKQSTNPALSWHLTTLPDVLRCCDVLLDECYLPSKKIEQIRVLRKMVISRMQGKGSHLTEEQRQELEDAYLELRRLKQFTW